MTDHPCRPTCSVCARDTARALAAARAELMPRLTPYFQEPEEGTRESAVAA